MAVYPFYLQYGVRPTSENSDYGSSAAGIATVVVFAETDDMAKARAARHIARMHWEITEVMRMMLIRQHHVSHMEGVLKSVYQEAERMGVAATFDGWERP